MRRAVFLIVPLFLTLVSAVLALGSPSFAATAQTSTALVREGRWLKYNGHYQYFVGFDNQELVADTSIDYISVLDALRDARVNKVRIWLDAYWNPNYEHPWVRRNGKYDLDQWNLRYWQRLADFMTAAHHRGIIVEVTLFAVSPADPDWWGNTTFQIAWHEANNVNGAFRTNADGTFFPQFFDLDHREVSASGRTMSDYQHALVDKALSELGSLPNVLFEIANEFPGDFHDRGYIDQVHSWQNYWASYLKQRTARPVAVHAHDSSGPQTRGVRYYWDDPNVDILNFHFYADANAVGGLLRSSQLKGKVLQSNESFNYQQSDSYLDRVTREAWGFLTAGAYYGFYHENALDPASIDKLSRLTAVRTVAESVRFWEMSTVDASGNEYDALVSGDRPRTGRCTRSPDPSTSSTTGEIPRRPGVSPSRTEVHEFSFRRAPTSTAGMTPGTRSFSPVASSPEAGRSPSLRPRPHGPRAPARCLWFSARPPPLCKGRGILTRPEAAINHDWAFGSPDASIGTDTFTAR